jgi:hypothetical protein
MAYATEVLADSPVLYWRRGEPSGGTAQDATANNRDGTINGGPAMGVAGLLTGDADTAIDFETSSGTQYVSRADEAALDIAGNLTMEAWFRLESQVPSNSFYGIMGKQDYFLEYVDTGGVKTLDFGIVRAPVTATFKATYTAELTVGTIYHVVATFNVTTGAMILYLNNAVVATQTVTGTPGVRVNAELFVVGRWSTGGDYFDGVIDEPALYSSVLSPTRVDVHYLEGTGGAGAPAAKKLAALGAV